MHAIDVFVHGSRNEPFDMVVIEAMALGKSVVASAEGGPTEAIAWRTSVASTGGQVLGRGATFSATTLGRVDLVEADAIVHAS
jgi:glycogen synthase